MKNKYTLPIIFTFILLTFFACSKNSDAPSNNTNSGQGGSFARFTIVNNHLYSIDNTQLHIYNISQPQQPALENTVDIGLGIETLFSFKNYLFIGANNGMYIYDISNPNNPTNSITFEHATACDPVVANDSLAFITLRSGGRCLHTVDAGLYIVNIKNINNPVQINKVDLMDPYGLGYDGNTLFVCDGAYGLKIFDYTNPSNLQPILNITDFITYDVIPLNGTLLVVGPNEFREYDYSDLQNIHLISTTKYEL